MHETVDAITVADRVLWDWMSCETICSQHPKDK